MLVRKFTKNNIVQLSLDSSLQDAMISMDQVGCELYPVVDNNSHQLLGVITRKEVEKYEDPQTTLDQVSLEDKLRIEEDKHIFEAIRLILKHEVRLLPVVNSEDQYIGIIRKQEIMEALSDILNLSELGSILTIEMEQYDFTLTKLVELIETEGAKILGLAVEPPKGQENQFRVSIKLNTRKTGSITETLRRFGYHVTINTENDVSEIDYQARASELMHYIDM